MFLSRANKLYTETPKLGHCTYWRGDISEQIKNLDIHNINECQIHELGMHVGKEYFCKGGGALFKLWINFMLGADDLGLLTLRVRTFGNQFDDISQNPQFLVIELPSSNLSSVLPRFFQILELRTLLMYLAFPSKISVRRLEN